MSRVIAAVDDSAQALAVVRTGEAVASLCGGTLEVVHVCAAEDDAAPAGLASGGHEVRLLKGLGSRAIAEAAADRDVAAVIVGTGRARPAEAFIGSCAQQVITAVPVPVVVVPAHARAPTTIRRILIPLDGTRASSDALRRAMELSAQADVRLIALHVHTDASLPMFSDQPHHEVRAWSAEFIRRHALPMSAESPLRLRVGQAGTEVLAAAVQEGADLIVLGWRQDLSAGRAAVVRSTVLGATVPVLLFPTQREARKHHPVANTRGRAVAAAPYPASRPESR